VIDRVLYKLDDLVRPYVHKILVVIEPLLIDEDYYARVEGREIISNLAKVSSNAVFIAMACDILLFLRGRALVKY
jgi:splicing factor 3B subunit 1